MVVVDVGGVSMVWNGEGAMTICLGGGGGGGTQYTTGWHIHSSQSYSSSPIFFIIHLVTLTMVRSGGINAVLIGHDLLQI